MTNSMPNAKEMLDAYLKFYRDIAVLFRYLNGNDPTVAQESSDVLQQLGTCGVPYLVYQLSNSKNRDLSLRIIEVFEKIGPPAWEVALPQLYPTLKDNADPVVSARLIEAFKCLTPYRPPAAAERPMGQEEQPPRPGASPDEASDPVSRVGSSNVVRTSASAGKSRRRAKATRESRTSSDDPLISRE